MSGLEMTDVGYSVFLLFLSTKHLSSANSIIWRSYRNVDIHGHFSTIVPCMLCDLQTINWKIWLKSFFWTIENRRHIWTIFCLRTLSLNSKLRILIYLGYSQQDTEFRDLYGGYTKTWSFKDNFLSYSSKIF